MTSSLADGEGGVDADELMENKTKDVIVSLSLTNAAEVEEVSKVGYIDRLSAYLSYHCGVFYIVYRRVNTHGFCTTHN